MELWFSDYHTEKVKVSVKVQKQLFGLQTEFQRIDVFDSDEFGRFLSADGSIVFSEKDEFIYDEMVVHIPMAVHPNVKHVLVIGGGDGGVARELGHYKEIETIDVVEPDRVFVEVCKEYFPDNACGLSDPRVTVYYEDGLRFLRSKQNMYDLIINDATDPFGHTEGLFTKEFYGNCFRALKDDGIMVYQHGSPFYDEDEAAACKLRGIKYYGVPYKVYKTNDYYYEFKLIDNSRYKNVNIKFERKDRIDFKYRGMSQGEIAAICKTADDIYRTKFDMRFKLGILLAFEPMSYLNFIRNAEQKEYSLGAHNSKNRQRFQS